MVAKSRASTFNRRVQARHAVAIWRNVGKSALTSCTFARAHPVTVVALILWFAIGSPGQVQGRVRGLIQDASGSLVAGAEIVAHSSRENTDRAYVSAADGSFTVNDLP